MIFLKNLLFLKSIRVLYQGESLGEITDKKRYDYITVISYTDLALEKEGFSVKHKKVANIYLTKTAEEILMGFSRSTRREIHKTQEIPELEFKFDDTNLAETYQLYRQFEFAQGRVPWKIDSFSGTILFNAYYRGKLIAAVPCYDIFPHLQVRAIFSSRLDDCDRETYKIVGSATRRLIFEICKYGMERHYEFVGLGSINYSTSQKSKVADFKMFFGPKVGDEYTYSYKSRRLRFLQSCMLQSGHDS